jgi:hypothetical protein
MNALNARPTQRLGNQSPHLLVFGRDPSPIARLRFFLDPEVPHNHDVMESVAALRERLETLHQPAINARRGINKTAHARQARRAGTETPQDFPIGTYVLLASEGDLDLSAPPRWATLAQVLRKVSPWIYELRECLPPQKTYERHLRYMKRFEPPTYRLPASLRDVFRHVSDEHVAFKALTDFHGSGKQAFVTVRWHDDSESDEPVSSIARDAPTSFRESLRAFLKTHPDHHDAQLLAHKYLNAKEKRGMLQSSPASTTTTTTTTTPVQPLPKA